MLSYELDIHPKMSAESGIDLELISKSLRILTELD